MKVKLRIHSDVGARWRRMVSFTHWRLGVRGAGGAEVRSECDSEEEHPNTFTEFEPWVPRCCFMDWATSY